MIVLRPTGDRRHEHTNEREIWLTFSPSRNRTESFADSFGVMEDLSEGFLSPGVNSWQHGAGDGEIITYVVDGSVVHSDSEGRSGIMQAGEFGYLAVVQGFAHKEANFSQMSPARLIRVRFRAPGDGLANRRQRRRFGAGQRSGKLCVVASSDGREGSLMLRQDAVVFSALLDPGQHVDHELMPGRMAWVHVVRGGGILGHLVVGEGDGAGLVDERAVAFTAREETELLLIELDHQTLSASQTSPPSRSSHD